jgi:hypothetical protein
MHHMCGIVPVLGINMQQDLHFIPLVDVRRAAKTLPLLTYVAPPKMPLVLPWARVSYRYTSFQVFKVSAVHTILWEFSVWTSNRTNLYFPGGGVLIRTLIPTINGRNSIFVTITFQTTTVRTIAG